MQRTAITAFFFGLCNKRERERERERENNAEKDTVTVAGSSSLYPLEATQG